MQRPLKRTWVGLALMLLFCGSMVGCAEPKEEARAPVISKKISIQDQLPPASTTSDATPLTAAVAASETPDEIVAQEPDIELPQRIYDPEQRVNPFTPLFSAQRETVLVAEAQSNTTALSTRQQRIPQTPLERIGLNQLKLVAIIQAPSGNRAMVEDNSGKGFIISEGTYIGLNSGVVTQINANRVIVEEELENLRGELILQNTELMIQKPVGE